MGPYYIPRDVKDEGRILFIFTGKSLIYTTVGAIVGLLFYFIFSALSLTLVGVIIMLIFGLIGFAIGTFKVPNIATINFTKKTGGENIDDIILRAIKFKLKRNKIYVYQEEEDTKDE